MLPRIFPLAPSKPLFVYNASKTAAQLREEKEKESIGDE